MFYAHSLDNMTHRGSWHGLRDHLIGTSALAAGFAAPFGGQFAAALAGLFHDLGKYSPEFQTYIAGAGQSVDHSTAGAQQIQRLNLKDADRIAGELIAYAIAGHHAGLADCSQLNERLSKSVKPLDPVWQTELAPGTDSLWPGWTPSKDTMPFQLGFFGRMIFSCLVDADYKDTEQFYAQHEQRIIDRVWPRLDSDIEKLVARFDAEMSRLSAGAKPSDLNTLRSEILAHVRAQATLKPGLFTLTVPTGGGKTLASLGFALEHARIHGMRRIIAAIPFTSIIDQNAAIFRHVLGDDYVLEHHSSIDEQKLEKREQRDKLKLAMEDWAAPVVVTTNVQLFESLFANRPSRCRKLHNLAGSVIILDEAQTLPLRLLRPCMAALDELARNYGATVVLCTATQPALGKQHFREGMGLDLEGRELAPDPGELARRLRRVTISTGHELDDDELVATLAQHDQALVIVNSRRHALDLYRKAKVEGLDGLLHLTTRQYARQRRGILDGVRQALKDHKPCRVIATSLIEAGVDVDFPRVWRAETGLDQIAQAAGRCNREGHRLVEDSIVTVFRPKDHAPPAEIAALSAAFHRVTAKGGDLLSPDAIRDYFQEVYWQKGAAQLDEREILSAFSFTGGRPQMNYETVAQKFRMIESGMAPVIIDDHPDVTAVLDRLNSAEVSPGKAARDLQTFVVQIPPKALEELIRNGRVAYHRPDLWGDQFAVLTDMGLYPPDTGLIWEDADVLQSAIL
ncbi:MAG TPA: CRISPR-associated endonuclease Cas3'' [Asticcacaulis sp.]|nr:CRISPR-associated endonuclease Cas3'' [Asticcacaulis sp.]